MPLLGASGAALVGNWTQLSGPTLPLALHVSLLAIYTRGSTVCVNRTFADGANAGVAQDHRCTPANAGKSIISESLQGWEPRLWTPEVFSGLEFDVTATRDTVTTAENASSLSYTQQSILLSSQRRFNASETHTLHATADGKLKMTIKSNEPHLAFEFTFGRAAQTVPHNTVSTLARRKPPLVETSAPRRQPTADVWPRGGLAPTWYNYDLNASCGWTLTEACTHEGALLISLQGLANREHAALYLTYGDSWAFSYTAQVRDFVVKSRNTSYHTLSSPAEALHTLRAAVKGYVLWDPSVRESLLVAYTAAGQADAVVAAPDLEPLLKSLGLPKLADYSTSLRGMTSLEVYEHAKERYWSAAAKTEVAWLGGECNGEVRPGIGDVGVARKLFFTDLSTKELGYEAEYAAANALVEDAVTECVKRGDPPPILLGWHSYCKDYEHTFVTLASSHAARVHGLNTNPNLSFMSQLPLPPDYTFHNRGWQHEAPPAAAALDGTQARTHLNLVQTDGLGLGAWTKPGRGAVPYTWEVTIVDYEVQPALLQMFYEQATANDTFVAALSGPGYTYPKAIPPSQLPAFLARANAHMKALDLHVMVTFDASAADTGGHTVTGDTTLTPEVVSAYAEHLPAASTLLNGYGPSFTFATMQGAGRNLTTISFDYYLDPSRSVADAAADLVTLAEVNPRAPYALAVHVREWSDVTRVARILNALPAGQFAVLPLREWVASAVAHPTFRQRFI